MAKDEAEQEMCWMLKGVQGTPRFCQKMFSRRMNLSCGSTFTCLPCVHSYEGMKAMIDGPGKYSSEHLAFHVPAKRIKFAPSRRQGIHSTDVIAMHSRLQPIQTPNEP